MNNNLKKIIKAKYFNELYFKVDNNVIQYGQFNILLQIAFLTNFV